MKKKIKLKFKDYVKVLFALVLVVFMFFWGASIIKDLPDQMPICDYDSCSIYSSRLENPYDLNIQDENIREKLIDDCYQQKKERGIC